MQISHLDHLVLTVRDLHTAIAFYTQVLGMEAITFGAGRRALQFGQQKINLHLAGSEIEPHAVTPVPGSADLCFISSTPLETVREHLQAQRIAIIAEGERTGAQGRIQSLYVRDPDGNLIEIANYLE